MVADAAAIVAAWLGAMAVSTPASVWVAPAAGLYSALPVLVIGYSIFSASRFYQSGSARKDYLGLVGATTLLTLSSFLLFKYFQAFSPGLSKAYFLAFWGFATVLVPLNRFIVDVVTTRLRQLGFGLYPAFLIADGPKQNQATQLIKSEGHYKV
ncbi:MAG: hypothetical protein EA368_02190, partial [Leptolyngbya sp. DLM2.Bin27]